MVSKSEDQLDGSSKAFEDWLNCLPGILDCRVSPGRDGASVTGHGHRWQSLGLSKRRFAVKWRPNNVTQWRNRLLTVEKLLAQTILSPRRAYRVRIDGQTLASRRGTPATVLRVAYGLSLDHVPHTRCRFTAYHVDRWKLTWLREGGDRLFEQTLCEEGSGAENTDYSFKQIFDLIQAHLFHFAEHSIVTTYQRALNRQLGVETDHLSRLYFGEAGNAARLHGYAPNGLRGDAAIEAEYRQRMRQIWQRSRVAVTFEVISIGVILTEARLHRRSGKPVVALPFTVSEPI